MMQWQGILGIFAGIVQIIATAPYILSILQRKTRPNLISWILWTITASITLVAQIASGASWSLFLLVGVLVCTVTVVYLCLRGYGYREFGKIDIITLGLSIIAIGGWFISSNPLVAMLCAVTADCVAYAPTISKMCRHPETEQALYWGLLTLADSISIISVTTRTTPNYLFPIAYGCMNGVGFVILVVLNSRTCTFATKKRP